MRQSDFTALDKVLMSDRAPDNGMQISDLDGFLTGLAVNPNAISQAEFMPVLWGGEEPTFKNAAEAKWVVDTILARYAEIEETLRTAPDELDPIFWEGPDGQIIVDDWAAGFLDAVSMRPDDWRALFEDDDAFLAIAPIIIAAHNLETVENMGLTAAVQQETLRELPQILTSCLVRMRDVLNSTAGPSNDNSANRTQ